MPNKPNQRDNMGLVDFNLSDPNTEFKKSFQWLFLIPEITTDVIRALPPTKSSRPKLGFKENSYNHLTETISIPVKAEWKEIDLTLYDIAYNENLIYNWYKQIYDVEEDSKWTPYLDAKIKKTCHLEMYNGCGCVLEVWTFENAYPTSIDFGDVSMEGQEIMTINLSLKYDRAFWKRRN